MNQCDNMAMMKTLTHAVLILAGAAILSGGALAQDSPSTPAPTAPKAAPAKTGQTGTTAAAKKPATSAAAKKSAPLTLTTPKQKASYALGMNQGRALHKNDVDIDPNVFFRGLKDGLAGAKPLMTDQEAQAALTELQKRTQQAQTEKMKVAGLGNRKIGDEFLAANKAKDGVVALPSGLQYKILTVGTGPKPAATDTVVCNYRGTLLNGSEFDSSYKRGQPATFAVSGVIRGWTEALQLMPVGSKWQLFIPADLAYGDRAAGADIVPGSTLIFEVELLSIQPKPAAK